MWKRPLASGTILLAVTDEAIRTQGARALRGLGYKVLSARDAVEAMWIAASETGGIDLLVADVVMPGLNGHVLAETLRKTRHDLMVLYTSEYSEDSESLQEFHKAEVAFIQKPFTPLALAQKVREVLGHAR